MPGHLHAQARAEEGLGQDELRVVGCARSQLMHLEHTALTNVYGVLHVRNHLWARPAPISLVLSTLRRLEYEHADIKDQHQFE